MPEPVHGWLTCASGSAEGKCSVHSRSCRPVSFLLCSSASFPSGLSQLGGALILSQNPCPLSSCPTNSVPRGVATHTSLTPQLKRPIRATARMKYSPGSILLIRPFFLPGEPTWPASLLGDLGRRRAMGTSGERPSRVMLKHLQKGPLLPCPRPSPFLPTRPPCSAEEGSLILRPSQCLCGKDSSSLQGDTWRAASSSVSIGR